MEKQRNQHQYPQEEEVMDDNVFFIRAECIIVLSNQIYVYKSLQRVFLQKKWPHLSVVFEQIDQPQRYFRILAELQQSN